MRRQALDALSAYAQAADTVCGRIDAELIFGLREVTSMMTIKLYWAAWRAGFVAGVSVTIIGAWIWRIAQ